MIENGTWATDIEIVATATLLQTDIFTYVSYGNKGQRWLKYGPLFPIDAELSNNAIYLINRNNHFELYVFSTYVLNTPGVF